MRRFDLLNHPVRLRIAQLLYGRQMTTTQVADVLKDVPKASLYRHISRMLEGGALEVVETHLVRGIEERVLTTVKAELNLSDEDLERGIDTDEFADFVRVYGTLAADEMASFVAASPAFDVDELLFRDYDIAVTDAEFAALRSTFWRMLDEFESRPPGEGRKLRRVLVLSYPIQDKLTAKREDAPDEHENDS